MADNTSDSPYLEGRSNVISGTRSGPTFHFVGPDQPLRVRADTNPGSLAKSIVMTLQERESRTLTVRAMGPAPVNQLVKGLIIARQQLVAQAKDISYVFGFDSHREGADEITVIQCVVTLKG